MECDTVPKFVWKNVKDEMPDEYDWIFVLGLRGDDYHFIAQIARYINGKWSFHNTQSNKVLGPMAGDAGGLIATEDIRYWMEIPWDDEDVIGEKNGT
ncbi:MAG: hypothetical protein KAS32_31630 [Candidatus Peribacteraceae bacterium]|nr:hypothetical protein [Candidatus Peribacteraceae bacterium]